MRPLNLSMTAFGPFPGCESIDFTSLGENPLFLINGPTGSGKTTILDAICFALYGRTTGDEREGAQMRSDQAGSDTLTEVSFAFELAGRRFVIRRSPEQQRPKARGEGFTTQAPEAELKELLADGSENLLVASKVSEATREIETLTGLSVDQFRQVMVLPQGKFRQLLLADSSEREKIFGQLFQTRIYRRLEEQLKERAAGIRRQREEQLNRQRGILDGAEVASTEALDDELADITPACSAAEKVKEAQEQAFGAADKALLQAENLARDFDRLAKATANLERCELERPRIDAIRQQIDHAEQAAKLAPRFADRRRCEQELSQAKSAAEAATERLAKAETGLQEAAGKRQASAALQNELKQANEELVRLKGFGDRVGTLTTARSALHLAEHRATEAELLLRFKQQADHYLAIHNRDQKLREVAGQREILARMQQQEEGCRGELKGLETDVKRLELAWHQGQAAILARELEAGAPCPVCGSTEHPAPATTAIEVPDQQQLEAAREELRKAADTLEAAKLQTLSAQERLRDLEREAQALAASISAETSLASLKVEIAAVQEQAKGIDISLPDRDQVQQLDVETLRGAREQARGSLATAQAQFASAESELPEAYREAGALDRAEAKAKASISRIEQQLAQLEESFRQATNDRIAAQAAADAAAAQVSKAGTALAAANTSTAEAIAASPFADEPTYHAARLEDAALQGLKQQVATFDTVLAEQSGIRKELGAQLREQSSPDLDQLREVRTRAEAARNLARDSWSILDQRRTTLQRTKGQIDRAAAESKKLDEEYKVIGTLSDVANGQTGHKISLQRFVLSVLLDDVLVEASRRLSLMSKGRYQLLRKEDRAKGNKASGLELEVEDAYTGKQRPVATLSGGESFMAALSLALGLSDVVQAYAGGIRLDTLFIDEGFGSLDAESLELAIRTLVDLQATGRMVGIISHVAELKEQLPLRIDVAAGRSGSSIRVVTP